MNGLDFIKFGISDEYLKKILLILAVDIGHGETTACCIQVGKGMLPAPMNLDGNMNHKILTGLFKKNADDSKWILLESGKNLSLYDEVHIEFKSTPGALNNGETEAETGYTKRELLQEFIKTLLEELKEHNENVTFDPDSVLLFVGAPSSALWKGQELEYAGIIREVSPYPVVIMPESRAALFKTILDKKGDEDLLEHGLIVIDFGSLTIDWTYLFKDLKTGRVESDEDSLNLGGALVENQIYKTLIGRSNSEKNREIDELCSFLRYLPGFEGMTEEELKKKANETYEKKFAGDKAASGTWEAADVQKFLLELRGIKEDYNDSDGALKKNVSYETKDNSIKSFTIDRTFMEEGEDSVIHQKLELTTKDGFLDMGWYDACEKLFCDIKERVEGRPYSFIVLTGGASRMGFVKELCEKVFPDITIVPDQNPSACVARGMAYAGEMDIRARLEQPRVVEKIMEKINTSQLYDACAEIAGEELKSIIYQTVIWPALNVWKDMKGIHKPSEICELCRKRLKELQNQPLYQIMVKQALASGIKAQKQDIINIINESYHEIYRREIPEAYQITIDDEQLSQIAGGVIHYTFNNSFENIIVGALSYLGGRSGIINTIHKNMDDGERKKRVERIESDKRGPVIEGYCRVYLEAMIRKLFGKQTTQENLRKCIESAVGVILDDLAAFFA